MKSSFLKVLAIDYGTKKIGIAVSRGSLAEPIGIIPNDSSIDRSVSAIPSALENIKQICKTEAIDRVVIGISENEMAQRTKKFAEELKAYIEVPIELFDETLSSYEAKERLIAAGASLERRKEPFDHYSAAIILEEWLEAVS